MKTRELMLAVCLVGGLSMGCADVCKVGERLSEDCGTTSTVTVDECRAHVDADCTAEEEEKLMAYYVCIEDTGECSDGTMGNEAAFIDCASELEGISADCASF